MPSRWPTRWFLLIVPALLAVATAVRAQPRLGVADLAVTAVDTGALAADPQSLSVTGVLGATVENRGEASVDEPVALVFFADRDGDAAFSLADTRLAVAMVGPLAVGARQRARTAASGELPFRAAPIFAVVDPAGDVEEWTTDNNLARTGADCHVAPAPLDWSRVRLEWAWAGAADDPADRQVMTAPLVVDLTADGIPEVVFASFAGAGDDQPGRLRALDGRTGDAVLGVTDAARAVCSAAALAAADIDRDGRPELLAGDADCGRLLAFEHDGQLRWRADPIAGYGEALHSWGGPAVADLDRDGTPEIVLGGGVLDASGRQIASGNAGFGSNGGGPLSVVADLDLDGVPEIIAGSTAYRADGAVWWRHPTAGDGLNAVADLDDDRFPEIVLVSGGALWLLEHDGATAWGPVDLPSGGAAENKGGPPTVGDVDGDGRPEIGVAGGSAYSVFELDGTLRWNNATRDQSSSLTGSTMFDFDADGAAEVVYSDELMLRVYRGTDGAVLWETASPSGTTHELPVVADVDADGSAELVVPSNDFAFDGPAGLRVFGHDGWAGTRPVWNQHSYHVTNVDDDGRVPAVERRSWQHGNTYRVNPARPDPSLAAPDLTAGRITRDGGAWPALTRIGARIGNAGAAAVPAGVPVAVYDGDPAADGRLIGVVRTADPLPPGAWTDVEVTWRDPPGGRRAVHVVAGDDGTGLRLEPDCDPTNDTHRRLLSVQPWPVFLPLTLRERCTPTKRPVDVALVLDASTSMREPSAAGRTKLEAEREAAALLLDRLQLADAHRAAIVAFNGRIVLEQPLTHDRAALMRALAAITPAMGTRLDLGIASAHRLLRAAPDDGREAVMVVLTDGRANPEPIETAVARAAEAKADGVLIVTVGLGDEVEADGLRQIASSPGRYYDAPDAEDLAAIYAAVAADIPCPPSDFWGRR